MSWIDLILPYDFSPVSVLAYGLALLLYIGALRHLPSTERPGGWQVTAFLIGLALCYTVMQTRFDYFAQYMFFMHRGQHLILHHLGPFLIALSNPMPALNYWFKRLPEATQRALSPLGAVYRVLQQPAIAGALFVGLIYFWLWPAVHFDAMLNRNLYWIMNWSMLLDGLLFWWLMLDPRRPESSSALGYGRRILVLALVALPQLVLGAIIVFSHKPLYDVYDVCGRAWPLAAETDQLMGGILTWIPPAMMSIIGILIILRRIMNPDRASRDAHLTRSSTGGAAL